MRARASNTKKPRALPVRDEAVASSYAGLSRSRDQTALSVAFAFSGWEAALRFFARVKAFVGGPEKAGLGG